MIKPKNGCGQMKTSFGVDIQLNKSFFNLVLRCHADNRGFGKVVCPCIDGHFSPFSLEFESNSLYSCNRELCTRANAMAGVVQPSCHSCHSVSLTANSQIVPVSEENTGVYHSNRVFSPFSTSLLGMSSFQKSYFMS